MKIGIQHKAYPERRNIIGLIPNAEYVLLKDKYSEIRAFKKKMRGFNILKKILKKFLKVTLKETYSFKTFKKQEVDFIHLFNSVSYGKEKWGVTFETIVPCHNKTEIISFLRSEKKVIQTNEETLKKMAQESCFFLIAISKSAYNIQKKYLKAYPKFQDKILAKTHILHPPQKVLIKEYNKTDYNKVINFMFVGSEFFCKGAIEILRVFDNIKNIYNNFNLILIGDINKSNGRCFLPQEEKIKLLKVIEDNNNIIHYNTLANKDVIKLMKDKAHVGLLPTHADTYGYSVLEFQAAGCPVISTNLRALSEINNNSCGWLIDIKISNLGEPFSFHQEELRSLQDKITNELEKIITKIFLNPSIIKQKGIKSIERIKEEHNPMIYKEKLKQIITKNNVS